MNSCGSSQAYRFLKNNTTIRNGATIHVPQSITIPPYVDSTYIECGLGVLHPGTNFILFKEMSFLFYILYFDLLVSQSPNRILKRILLFKEICILQKH
jgi:hypothetical protein